MLWHNSLTSALCLTAGLLAPHWSDTAAAGAWVQACAWLGGAASWTLVEYVVHRWVFHYLVPASHAKHHAHPREPRYLHGPTHVVFATWLSSLAVYTLLLGPQLGLLAVAGLNVTFLGFELLHAHVHREGGHWLLRTARIWHALHHKPQPAEQLPDGLGFVSPFWDLLFGTWPQRAPLPRWLILVVPLPLPLLHFALAAALRRASRAVAA